MADEPEQQIYDPPKPPIQPGLPTTLPDLGPEAPVQLPEAKPLTHADLPAMKEWVQTWVRQELELTVHTHRLGVEHRKELNP